MPAKNSKAPSAEKPFSLISDEKLLAMYAALLKCRTLSRRLSNGRKQRGISIAAAVGAAFDLLPGDTLDAVGPDAIARFVKGASLRRLLSGTTRQHSSAAVLKAAVRAARGHKAKRNKKVAVAFCSDPSAVEALWHQLLHETVSKRLPILFICRAGAEARDGIPFAPDFPFPAIVVDCNDVVAIYRVASEAVTHARRGNGPTLIVCQPFCPTNGNGPAVADANPILNMEKYLARKGLFTTEFKAKTTSSFARELRAAALSLEA